MGKADISPRQGAISLQNSFMARAGLPKQRNWYLREWMDLLGKRQADMCHLCNWNKATASQLYNNLQDYSPKLVNEAASALNVEPFELLMKPERAMAFRQQLQAAIILAHDEGLLSSPLAEKSRTELSAMDRKQT